jgi:trimethylamine--corrinoid protein Co-methyltransferase
MLDDEICGAASRLARGIEVAQETLALEVIKRVGYSGSYIAEMETSKLYRKESFMPKLFSQEPYETWENEGSKLAIDRAREKAISILAKHTPREVDNALTSELESYKDHVATRSIEDFYSFENEENQDFSIL